MNQPFRRGTEIVLPALPPREPDLSPTLADLVGRMANPHPDAGTRGVDLPGWLRREATDALTRYDQLARPAQWELIMGWLSQINQATNKPLDDDEFIARAAEIVDAIKDVPAGFFNSDTKRDAQRSFRWFPGAADFHGVLSAHVLAFNSRRRALKDLLATREDVRVPKPSDEERDAIIEKFHAKMATVLPSYAGGMTSADDLSGEARPRYLTRAQLRATLQAMVERGDPLAANAARARLVTLGDKEQDDAPG